MSFAHQNFNAPPPSVPVLEETSTRILMVYQTKGLDAKVKAGLEIGGKITVKSQAERLPADKVLLASYEMVIFETDIGHQFDLETLSALQVQPGKSPRLLALIESNLSLSDARRLMEAGVEEVLPLSAISPAQPAANQATTEEAAAPSTPVKQVAEFGKVTTILRARGGAGASTLAANMAANLSEPSAKGVDDAKSVVLVDLDIQNGSVGVLMNVADSSEFTSLIRAQKIPDAAFVQTALNSVSPTLSILSTPDELAPLTAISAELVGSLLDLLQSQFDHIILDMPQAIMDWFDPILVRSHLVLIVTDTSVPAIKQTKRLVDLVTEDHMTLPVEIVVNKERRPLVPNATVKEANNVLGRDFRHWIPNDPRAVRKSADTGVPLRLCAKRSFAATAIAKLANAVRHPNTNSNRKSV